MCCLFVLLFLGGGDFGFFFFFKLLPNFILLPLLDLFFAFKTIVFVFLFVFIRANLPRFRFDQLMFIC